MRRWFMWIPVLMVASLLFWTLALALGGMSLMYPDRLDWPEGDFKCQRLPEDYYRELYYDTAGPVRTAAIAFACAPRNSISPPPPKATSTTSSNTWP